MKRWLLLGGGVAFLAVLIGWNLHSDRKEELEDHAIPEDRSDKINVADAVVLFPASNAKRLPDLNAPFRETLAGLRKMSAEGSSSAACRIVTEYLYCRRAASSDGKETKIFRRDESGDDVAEFIKLRSLEIMLDEELVRSKHCRGADLPDYGEIIRELRAAALGGQLSAMTYYSSGTAFKGNHTLDVLAELASYKKEAESIAKLAAQRGDIQAILVLADAYESSPQAERRSLLAQAVEQNNAEALALLYQVRNGIPSEDYMLRPIKQQIERRISMLESRGTAQDVTKALQIVRTKRAVVVTQRDGPSMISYLGGRMDEQILEREKCE